VTSWTDKARGITEDKRTEMESRRTYIAVLKNLGDRGVVDHHRPDGSRLLIYMQVPMDARETA
jgi:hypothetical protein